MGAINGRLRRHRRNRLAAEMHCTWTPRRLFTFGTSVGWGHWYDNPDDLYRRRNRLTYTRDFTNSVWVKARSTASAPSGGFTTITEDTSASASHYWYRTAESAPVGTYGVYTLRVKKSATRNFALWVGSNASNPIDGFRRFINLSTGGTAAPVIDGTGVVEVSTTVTEYDTTTWLITCVMQIATGGTAFGILNCLVNGASVGNTFYTGDGSSSIQAGYAQLETYTTTATEYQDVPTTWEQAYLDAVGAERIFAWQDSAGTTPVTAVGQSVGLILDRAYGGMRGPERVTNGRFDANVTGWTHNGGGSVVWSAADGGVAVVTTGGTTYTGAYQVLNGLVVGKTYEASARVKAGTYTGQIALGMDGIAWGTLRTNPTSFADSRMVFVATGTSIAVKVVQYNNASTGETFIVDDITVREIPGTHRIQASAPSRPLLMARVNQMLASETLGSTVWDNATPNLATVSGTLVTAATGGTLSMRRQALTLIGGTALKTLFRLSAGSATQSRLIVRDNTNSTQAQAYLDWSSGVPSLHGASNGTWTISLVGSQYWVVNTFTLGAGASISTLISLYPDSAAGTGTVNCHGVDLRTADDAAKNIPAYQRVGATAADHDTAGYPMYLLYDGTDDSYASTATVAGSGSDKVTVVTGVTKNSDASVGTIMEASANSSTNNGAFTLFGPSGGAPDYGFRSKGTALSDNDLANIYPAPRSDVITCTGDIAAGQNTVRLNGVQVGSVATDQGTGNYGNHTIYWGARGGSSNRFIGRDYGGVARFGPMSETERNRLESWFKNWMRMP